MTELVNSDCMVRIREHLSTGLNRQQTAGEGNYNAFSAISASVSDGTCAVMNLGQELRGGEGGTPNHRTAI
ncbi:hypothetical protein CC1G_02959 [Coprinopsis cinerea okayama7|uniref:Uncharacterized protein n=1 Tax=Coprinopsis cinerea (strain Okayama-7 / 130 / ATCC MYA-4618 / FGSC 9003) TaxID=240176 RepID=A8NRW3_COPC7|nr:hypothetical protein CC1G_02959 [Coprinopsis cinerea okayama7\|eukprot:XP_001835871.2 hypothetical protein CC1G_02959 [Coprinopsis cinerea okayama7\